MKDHERELLPGLPLMACSACLLRPLGSTRLGVHHPTWIINQEHAATGLSTDQSDRDISSIEVPPQMTSLWQVDIKTVSTFSPNPLKCQK